MVRSISLGYAIVSVHIVLFSCVSSSAFGGPAKTTAYIHDAANGVNSLPADRTSSKYTVTIDGEGAAKPVHVYESVNDILWNGGDKCLLGENPPTNAECTKPGVDPVTADMMTHSNHWASFDFGGGYVTLTIRTECGGLTDENITDISSYRTGSRNRIVHPKNAPLWLPERIDANTFKINLYMPTVTHWPRQVYFKLPDALQSKCHEKNPLFVFFNPQEESTDTLLSSPEFPGCPAADESNNVVILGIPGKQTNIDPGGELDTGGGTTTMVATGSDTREPLDDDLELVIREPNSTYCIPGGAYVRGRIVVDNVPNVKIVGRGILSGVRFRHYRTGQWEGSQLIRAKGQLAKDLTVDGITLVDSSRSNIESDKKMIVNNVKILAWHVNTDGITGTVNTEIRDVFLKVNDDNLKMSHSNMVIENIVAWQQTAGSIVQMAWNHAHIAEDSSLKNLILIGADRSEDTTGRNYNSSLISARNLMSGTLRNMRFENIEAEVTPYSFLTLQLDEEFLSAHRATVRNRLSCNNPLIPGQKVSCGLLDGNGRIENILIKDVRLPRAPIYKGRVDNNLGSNFFRPESEPDLIHGISLHNITVDGQRLTMDEPKVIRKEAVINWMDVIETEGEWPGINTNDWE